MPSVSWSELNDIIHEIRTELVKLSKLQFTINELRDSISRQLEKLDNIILEQSDEEACRG